MKAYQYAKDLIRNCNVEIVFESDEDWTQSESEAKEIGKTRMLWGSKAPGSGAPACLMAGIVSSMENKGYFVDELETLFQEGILALNNNNNEDLVVITAKMYRSLTSLRKNEASKYWTYDYFDEFSKYEKASYIEKISNEIEEKFNAKYTGQLLLKSKLKYGWLGQIIAGAYGTALEGYDRKGISDTFGVVDNYLKAPSPYNDDITFEIALLKAYQVQGEDLNSLHIADKWLELIPYGWSAEDVAINNLKRGFTPPESGKINNPFSEWIGAQMRGAVCGMVYPGNPYKAAKLAWKDGQISHENNGIIGEVFNAVMTSISFVENDVKKIIELTYDCLPDNSEFKEVIAKSIQCCKDNTDPINAFEQMENEFEKYDLVHAYPNAAIEIISLWFGNGDFNKTLELVGTAGLDVDCNAAQIGTVVGIINSDKGIDDKWTSPIGKEFKTYLRGIPSISLDELIELCIR